MNAIVDGDDLQHINFLLEFLAAWETRPMCLTPMAYKWCSAISGVAGLGPESVFLLQLQPQNVGPDGLFSKFVERRFSLVGPGYDPVRTDEASYHTRKHPQVPTDFHPGMLLFMILEVGFRLVMPGRNQPVICLDHTPHHDLVFKSVFSTGDDEAVADGMCAWIADNNHMPAGSCVRYLTDRMEDDTPFSPRLRQMSICLIKCIRHGEPRGLETIQLLNRLEVGVDDMEDEEELGKLLADMMRIPGGSKSLSIHYWHLLERLPWTEFLHEALASRAVELVESLEEAEDWDKMEIWMVIAWQADWYRERKSRRLEGSKHLKLVTLKYLLR